MNVNRMVLFLGQKELFMYRLFILRIGLDTGYIISVLYYAKKVLDFYCIFWSADSDFSGFPYFDYK